MLSSLTYTGVPSKAFAQDWVYAVGNFMIPVVAIIAVFVALPFYRRIDATSAYEYLERRFNRPVRLFGNASFTLFHIFRMAVVMSLTGLALAVIWTDTVQTIVLLGGAVLAIAMLVAGVDGGTAGLIDAADRTQKFSIANLHWDPTITTDQVFPLFIAHEMPIGVAGTLIALMFVDPEIKSLFDQFIKVIGLFMGVIGGLFVLGAMTRRANGPGALIGALTGAAVMYGTWKYTPINGYLTLFSARS